MLKKVLLFSLLLLICLGGIGYVFWEQEYKYTMPTPVPADLAQINNGDSVELPFTTSKKNLFIHFYNYDCPCSRFNINEFQSMVRRHSDSVEFIAVLQADKNDKAGIEKFKKKYDLGIRVINDPDGNIASILGIYSTPQAVLIKNNQLFYKGNYNRARFCLSRNTKFAEMALQAMVNNEPAPEFPEVALVAYGCELPSNESESDKSILFSIF